MISVLSIARRYLEMIARSARPLSLDHDQRDSLAGHLDRMRVRAKTKKLLITLRVTNSTTTTTDGALHH